MISGVGGQMDFVRGSSLSPGGKSIFAFTSKTDRGISRIVPTLSPGSAVTTTRNHVQYVVTENGVINLHGLSMVERARAIISIASPDERDNLEKYARGVFPNF
jgi:acyl-CoA hydrolase